MTDMKMKILERLEAGEITAEEALAMMGQIKEPGPVDPRQIDPRKAPHFHEPLNNYRHEDFSFDDTPDWLDSIVGWVGEVVEEITDSVKDSDVKSNVSDLLSGTYGHYKRTESFTSQPVLQGLSRLELGGKNEKIEIYAYDGNCVQIRCDYDARRPNEYVQFHDENGHIALWFDEKAMRSVKVMCYVPRVHIGHVQAVTKNARIVLADINAAEISLTTKNDKITVESAICSALTAITKNDSIKIADVSGDNIHIETSNDKITAEDIHAGSVTLKTTNAGIKTANIDAVHLVMNTTNASLKMKDTLPDASGLWECERTLDAFTTNGSIRLGMPGGIGFAVEANTTDGKVTCDIPLYRTDGSGKMHLVGESMDYAAGTRRLRVKLGSTNASVKIGAV